MRLSVKAEIAQRKAEGNFFRKDPTKTMMGNALDAVEWLAEEGAKATKAGLPGGFTRDNIEATTYKRVQMVTGKNVQSRFGKSRLKPGLSRSPAGHDYGQGRNYGPERRPYITLWVYETGHYGGSRGADLSRSEARRRRRSRTVWNSASTQNRRAHWPVKKAYNRMKAYWRAIRVDLTKGLE